MIMTTFISAVFSAISLTIAVIVVVVRVVGVDGGSPAVGRRDAMPTSSPDASEIVTASVDRTSTQRSGTYY